ncbi:glycosyltransferase [Clostridiales Family XIII bacterium ASD5510]|uniref:Glycosyltransferase n=1 Tax=Hominibacterium faecale TaxID=2839743 RepID=A0A9J6QY49_9FIRM|nr:glycosyltransferase [Hominibacterium faecale]MCU7380412.1 glycosyltransferase [Hominibacterium faecale]
MSIVIPTKDRSQYLKYFVEYIDTFATEELELIIQDNSEDNSEIELFLQNNSFKFLKYYHDATPMPIIDNSDLAIKHAKGKYICYMGDDDFISSYILCFVKKMDMDGIEAAVFNRASFNWPGVTYVKHKLKNLRIPKLDNSIKYLNVKTILNHCMHIGASRIENMPRVYHGIIKKECMDKVFEKAGTYFPGPSPDMANAIALCSVVKKHVYYGIPIVSSGTCPKSAGGLGAKHEHVGELRGKSFLPKDIEQRWDVKLPKVWTGETIYAQSAIEAMKALDMTEELKKFNYIYVYAAFRSFHGNLKEMINHKFNSIDRAKYGKYILEIFWLRVKSYIGNMFESKLGVSRGSVYDNVKNSKIAAQIVDDSIEAQKLKII